MTLSSRVICVPACPFIGGYALTIPPQHTLPPYPRTQHPPCPLPQATTIGGGLSPLNHGRAAATPTIGTHRYLSMLRRDLTPGLAPSQHLCMPPHLTPTSSPPTPVHPIAISILAVTARTPGLVPTIARTELP